MKPARIVTVVLVSAAATLALGWAARANYDSPGGESAVLRLSWRLRGEREEKCRPRTQAELDALPVHMRTPEICEGSLVAYRLVVQVDDGVPDTSRVLPAGAKGDRPIYVLKEKEVAPGSHRVRIDFAREDEADTDDDDEEDDEDDDAPVFAMDTVLDMSAGSIELITMAADGKRLVRHRPGQVVETR